MGERELDLNNILHYREMKQEGKVRLAIMIFLLITVFLISLDTNSLELFCVIFIPFGFIWTMLMKEMYKGGKLWKNNKSLY